MPVQKELPRGRKTEISEPEKAERAFPEKAGKLFELLAYDRMGDGMSGKKAFVELRQKYGTAEELYHALLGRIQKVVDQQRQLGQDHEDFMRSVEEYRQSVKEAWPLMYEQYQVTEKGMELTGSYAVDELQAFEIYTRAHSARLHSLRGAQLESEIYSSFYAEDIDHPVYDYREDDPATQRLLKAMAVESAHTFDYLNAQTKERGIDITPSVSKDEGWLYCNVGEMVDTSQEIGRFYVNVAPEVVHQYYKELLARVYREGIQARIKIPYKPEVGDLRRYDKLVVYVNALPREKEQVLLTIFEELAKQYDEDMESGKPRLSAHIRTSEGTFIKGLAFSQEPGDGESFGEIRSKVLAELYTTAQQGGATVSDKSFDGEVAYTHACKRYNVDPRIPALNANASEAFFPLIRSQLESERNRKMAHADTV